METTKQATCKEQVASHLRGRIHDIRKLWNLERQDPEASDPDLGTFNEYGLSFDYVAPGTFTGRRRGYFRYQLSWGGPSDEFRFYATEGFGLDRIEYWFLDWFDGAHIQLTGRDLELLTEVWDMFREVGTVEAEYKRAVTS